jgi:speckle-type POZ protein
MATKNGVDFAHLMKSGQFSDLKLVCQGKEFNIHKLVACPQSPVIAAALQGDFKVSSTMTARRALVRRALNLK